MNESKKITAVFFLSAGWLPEQMLEPWRDAGHRIACIVVRTSTFSKRQSSVLEHMAAENIPVLRLGSMVDWSFVAERLAATPADIAISYGFGRLIPMAILDRFPWGGVNFHPARLPAYRGPHPTLCMVADRAFPRHGGLTLHRMSAAFDEGEILAQAHFPCEDFQSVANLLGAISGTTVAMALDVIPRYCANQVLAVPQPDIEYPWARRTPGVTLVGADWTADEVAAAGAFLTKRPGLYGPDGRGGTVRIGRLIRRLGPPTGAPPRVGLFEVEFDCADARVLVIRAHRLGRILQRLRNRLLRTEVRPIVRPFAYTPLEAEATSSGKFSMSRPAHNS